MAAALRSEQRPSVGTAVPLPPHPPIDRIEGGGGSSVPLQQPPPPIEPPPGTFASLQAPPIEAPQTRPRLVMLAATVDVPQP
jgi:hypothetical protein